MDILRIPSNQIEADVEVSAPLTSYTYTITDLADNSATSATTASDSSSNVTIPLPSKYDGSYKITVDGEDNYFDVVRPYVDPTTKGANTLEINAYASNESLARAIIDSVIPEGFYYKKKVLETVGLGADYLPLWVEGKKVLKLYENNVLMYDSENSDDYAVSYGITDDKTAIVENTQERLNRLEGAPNIFPIGGSDLLDVKYVYRGFPRTFDYKILLAAGYPKIPSAIVKATELLVDDIECGKLEYYQRYIKTYNTDQFKIGFDGRMFEGTGNIFVDKILSKYAKSIRLVGVL
jgi:hypothetical protein